MNDRCQDNNNHLGDRAREGTGRLQVVIVPRQLPRSGAGDQWSSCVRVHALRRVESSCTATFATPAGWQISVLGSRHTVLASHIVSPRFAPSGRTRTSLRPTINWHLLENKVTASCSEFLSPRQVLPVWGNRWRVVSTGKIAFALASMQVSLAWHAQLRAGTRRWGKFPSALLFFLLRSFSIYYYTTVQYAVYRIR